MVDASKPARHSMAPFGIHSLTRQGGIGSRGEILPSDNLEDLKDSSRTPFNKFEKAESTSVNAMVNSTIKPVIPPAADKPNVPQDKPHIPSKPVSTNFNKDVGAGNDAIGIE